MLPSALRLRRLFAVLAAALILGATVAPQDADARAGRSGSFGSRGSKTWSSPPPTATSPGASQMQRSATQPGQPGVGSPSAAAPGAAAAARPGLFGGGLGAGLMGGLLGAGLFGLLAGNGFFGGLGSLSSILGFVIQLAVIFFVARFIMGWMRRRQQPEASAVGAGAPYRFDAPSSANGQQGMGSQTAASSGLGGLGERFGLGGGSSNGRSSGGGFGFGFGSGRGQPQTEDIQLEAQDFDDFERMLTDVQEAWSKQDLSRLRGLATPEMVEIFSEDLAEDASRGVVNKVSGIKLLQGDLAEAWREDGRDYATVAMRYELIDVTEDRETGQVVDGDATRVEQAMEHWTFLRAQGGRWLLTAIQQSEDA